MKNKKQKSDNMKTKNLIKILMLISIILTSINSFSQGKNDNKKGFLYLFCDSTKASLSSGEGPLSKGIFVEANFYRGNDILNVSIGQDDMYAVYLKGYFYLKDFGARFSIGPSLEWFYNVPLVGMMSTSVPLKLGDFYVSTMTWGGFSGGKPEGKVELLRWRWLFFWQSIDLNYKGFTTTGAIIQFDGKWGPLVDFKYKQPLTPKFTLFGSAGYSWYKPEKALLKLGLMYEFK